MNSVLLIYSILELLLSIHISLSNLLVLWVYIRYKHVRTATNTYIFSLALTDFLAGSLGIPVTVISVLTRQPTSYYGCLFVHLILCVLCTISTFHMLIIALDKYITICRRDQLFDTRHHRALVLIGSSWIIGTLIAIMPLFNTFGFAEIEHRYQNECHFTAVVDYRYLVYVIFFGTILAPAVFIIFCYVSIYSRIRKEEHQVRCLLRKSEREKRLQGRRKVIKILLILVVSYGICWYPLYIINTIDYFWPEFSINSLTLWAVVLSHMSCALNPLIYAYGMPGFKKALREFFNVHTASNNTCVAYSHYGKDSSKRRHNTNRSSQSKPQTPTEAAMMINRQRKCSAPLPIKRGSHHQRIRKTTLGNMPLHV